MSDKILNFELKREGFPVTIGGIEFFFGSSIEDLTRFFNLQEESAIQIEAIQKKIAEYKVTSDLSEYNVEKVLELNRDLTRVHYDAMLGAGSFDKIYATFPYVDVLLDNFDVIAESVANRIEKETDKRKDKYNQKKVELLKKKVLKNKKKK